MNTLIIPDIHLEHERAETIIRREAPDQIVFLGDYFDAANDTITSHRTTAQWLAWSCQQPNRIHLIGNHDPFYFTGQGCCRCPGNTKDKYESTQPILTAPIWKTLHTHKWLPGSWLLTHAGLTRNQIPPLIQIEKYLDQQEITFKTACEQNRNHNWFHPGRRGGFPTSSGPIWCDMKDFNCTPGINQIFGHSPRPAIEIKQTANSININLDAAIFSQKTTVYPGAYAIHDGHNMELYHYAGYIEKSITLQKT